jgi:hypothetical protein
MERLAREPFTRQLNKSSLTCLASGDHTYPPYFPKEDGSIKFKTNVCQFHQHVYLLLFHAKDKKDNKFHHFYKNDENYKKIYMKIGLVAIRNLQLASKCPWFG